MIRLGAIKNHSAVSGYITVYQIGCLWNSFFCQAWLAGGLSIRCGS